MNTGAPTFQIGKNGISDQVANKLDDMLKIHKHIRISLLKSSGRNRENSEEMAKNLVSKLKTPCKYTLIGFTIALRRVAK